MDWTTDNIPDLSGRVAIVTGATSGIGKETARELARKNADVILAVRNLSKGETVADEYRSEMPSAVVTVRELDLSSLESIGRFSDRIRAEQDRLDFLINNAGIMMCPYAETAEGFEIQMGTNHLGHFALTGHLLSLLKATEQSRLVVVSSIAHRAGVLDFTDFDWKTRKYDTRRAYGDSKLANLLFAFELARKLSSQGSNPRVTAAHPGWAETELQRHSGLLLFLNKIFAQAPDMGALPTLRAAFDDYAESGDYFGPARFLQMNGYPVKVRSNRRSRDLETASKLWEFSEERTGVAY